MAPSSCRTVSPGEAARPMLKAQGKDRMEAALPESTSRVPGRTGAAAIRVIPASALNSKIKSIKVEKRRFQTS
jgi:hypothetical protein